MIDLCNAHVGHVGLNTERVRTRSTLVHIIQVFTSLDHGKVYGLRVGLVVDLLGILQDAEREDTEAHQKMLLQNSV